MSQGDPQHPTPWKWTHKASVAKGPFNHFTDKKVAFGLLWGTSASQFSVPVL